MLWACGFGVYIKRYRKIEKTSSHAQDTKQSSYRGLQGTICRPLLLHPSAALLPPGPAAPASLQITQFPLRCLRTGGFFCPQCSSSLQRPPSSLPYCPLLSVQISRGVLLTSFLGKSRKSPGPFGLQFAHSHSVNISTTIIFKLPDDFSTCDLGGDLPVSPCERLQHSHVRAASADHPVSFILHPLHGALFLQCLSLLSTLRRGTK